MPIPESADRRIQFRVRCLAYAVSAGARRQWYRLVRSPVDTALWRLWDHGYLPSDGLLSRRNVLSHLPDQTRLRVSPSHLEQFVRFENRRAKRAFVWPGEWEMNAKPIEEHHRYQLMADAHEYRNNPRQSPSFRRLMEQSKAGKPKMIVNKGLSLGTATQIEAFLRQQTRLLDSIAELGMQPDLAVDEMNVAVGRHGALYKVNGGRKRTMASRLLGLNAIPVRITQMHPDWIARFRQPTKGSTRRGLILALQAVKAMHGVDSAPSSAGGRPIHS